MSHEAPTCRTCGTDRFVAKGDEYQTCVGYHSPPGPDDEAEAILLRFIESLPEPKEQA